MIEETRWQCEICKNWYLDKQKAIECEARGYFDFSEFPIGLLGKILWTNGLRREKGGPLQYGIFANFQNEPSIINAHLASEKMLAYRSWESLSDTLDPGELLFCSSGFISEHMYKDGFSKEDLELKETKGLIKQLRSIGIRPSYYENNKLIYL